MRQLVLFAALATVLFSCSGNKNQAKTADVAVELDQFLTVVDQKVDETVTVVGYVTHTCKHSGMKCFIVGESQKVSLQVMAEGEIKSFNADLVGSKLAITGIVKEHHISEESINEREINAKQLENQEGMAEACAAELDSVNDMRQWMKDHGKDYYIVYYMDGLKYEILD